MAYRSHPLKTLFMSFYNSITKKRIKGDFKGDDYFGNKYYELPAGKIMAPFFNLLNVF